MTRASTPQRFDETDSRHRLGVFPQPIRWHRPLLLLAAAMTVLSVVAILLAVLDPSTILGQNAWFKPLKFALSIAVYAISLAWMIGVLQRFQRASHWLGTVATIALSVEIIIITAAAATGTTSHFNVATPLNTTIWSIMAVSIVIAWIATLLVGIAVALTSLGDPARNLAIRSGVVLGLIGMAIAFFMTTPQPGQIADFQGIAGAHTVGAPDGGPGLPFLGWSTEAGDLRVPHFLGMHALQIIPLALVVLELLARRFGTLRNAAVRAQLILVLALGYAAALAITTLQALAGESVAAPSPTTILASCVVLIGMTGAGYVILTRSSQDKQD